MCPEGLRGVNRCSTIGPFCFKGGGEGGEKPRSLFSGFSQALVGTWPQCGYLKPFDVCLRAEHRPVFEFLSVRNRYSPLLFDRSVEVQGGNRFGTHGLGNNQRADPSTGIGMPQIKLLDLEVYLYDAERPSDDSCTPPGSVGLTYRLTHVFDALVIYEAVYVNLIITYHT